VEVEQQMLTEIYLLLVQFHLRVVVQVVMDQVRLFQVKMVVLVVVEMDQVELVEMVIYLP
tara:strand:+ start:79 stop:258 length:180 start_codon:yes stop_codon:yes gene_type:complete